MKRSLFQENVSHTIRMIICVVLCVAMLALDNDKRHLEGIRSGIELVISPVRYLINLPFEGMNWANKSLKSRQSLREQNTQLREENFTLKTQQQKMSVLMKENERLRKLLGSSVTVAEQSIVAELITVAMTPYKQTILINKGSNKGVFIGQPVISSNGIVGQVTHVSPFNATVLLISDSQHDIPLQSNRTGLRTLATGTGQSTELELLYIPNNSDIKEGDLMISSGLGGRFPSKYPVAVVKRIVRDPSKPFATVTATPTAELDKVKEVLLIWSEETPVPNTKEVPDA